MDWLKSTDFIANSAYHGLLEKVLTYFFVVVFFDNYCLFGRKRANKALRSVWQKENDLIENNKIAKLIYFENLS